MSKEGAVHWARQTVSSLQDPLGPQGLIVVPGGVGGAEGDMAISSPSPAFVVVAGRAGATAWPWEVCWYQDGIVFLSPLAK